MHLSLNSSSPTSALANRGQSCPRHGFLGYHDHHCFLHMRLWALAWALGPVQKGDADYWALRPHNSPSKFYCLAPRTERRILMSLGIPQAYYVLSSAGVSAFLTAQGMLLTLQHLERAFIKFLRLLPPTFYGVMAIQRWRFFTNLRARKLPLLSRFGYKYPFKSICPNYLCIQELLRTYVESTNLSHSLVSL